MLSRLGMSLRPLPAGPMTPSRVPSCSARSTVHYALAVGDVDPYAHGRRRARPARSPRRRSAGATGPTAGSALTVRGAEVSVVRREAGQLEVRVFNPRPTPTRSTIAGRSGWLVDLRGRPVAPFEGGFELRPHGIATARLDGD